jgi:hypothetical protein
MTVLIVLGLIVAGVAGLFYYLLRRGNEEFKRVVVEANHTHGTSFVVSGTTVLGSLRSRFTLVFDQKNRKLMFYYGDRRYDLRDYDYIRGWQLLWVESSTQHGLRFTNVRFEFRTSDLNQPLLYLPMTSKQAADAWHHRLSLLLDG